MKSKWLHYDMRLLTVMVVFFIPIVASAQISTTQASPAEIFQPTVHLVADVNLQDCTYTQSSTADQTITIVCNITNKIGNQGDIHYGVQLLKKTTNSQEIIATKAYDEVLSLKVNQTISQKIEYTPPNYLDGEYELWGLLKTSDGLPLSSNFLGKIILKPSATSYLEIKNSTCFLQVQGENTTYNLQQGVDIDQNETLEVKCTVELHSTGDTTVTSSLITYKRSVFGEVVSDIKDVQNPIIFKKNETKTISFLLPKVTVPQLYNTVLSFVSQNGVSLSNEITIQYILSGAAATIQNVLLDKNYYVAGETAIVSLYWSGPEDYGPVMRKPAVANTVKSVLISIKDSNNNSCAKETTFPAATSEAERGKLNEYSLPVTHTCLNPQVIITITDNTGGTLAQKTVDIVSSEIPKDDSTLGNNTQKTILFAAIGFFSVLLIVIGGYMYKIWKRKHEII